MEHTQIITTVELENYADTNAVNPVSTELIWIAGEGIMPVNGLPHSISVMQSINPVGTA